MAVNLRGKRKIPVQMSLTERHINIVGWKAKMLGISLADYVRRILDREADTIEVEKKTASPRWQG